MQIEIVPQKDGSWNWQRREDSKITDSGAGYESRSEALTAGREAAGSEKIWVKRSSAPSEEEEYLSSPNARVVLLDLEGNEVGELDAAPSTTSVTPIQVTLAPAEEASEGAEPGEGEG